MEPIKIYTDQLHEQIVLGKLRLDRVYDFLEQKIGQGVRVEIYVSIAYPDDRPLKEFNNLKDFKEWRTKKENYNKYLNDLFTPEK